MGRKPEIGIIDLGLTDEELVKFRDQLATTVSDEWFEFIETFDYKTLDPTEVVTLCDVLVLSPGNAPIGLLDHKRAENHPQIGTLYNLIQNAAAEGVPLIGINAGHEALNLAYGWAIDKVPDDKKEGYQSKQRVVGEMIREVDSLTVDQIAEQVGDIEIRLTNNYAVLPEGKQRKRWGQSKVKQLLKFMDYPLISRIDSEAPVYGVQFNIGEGTMPIFRNFFRLAEQYLKRE